jgi:DNA-binding transcriptional ArsR family regulator
MKASELKRLSEHSQEVGHLLKVIAHPTRLLILTNLKEGEMSVGQLVKLLGIPQARLSQHLTALRTGGAVSRRSSGHLAYYSISNPVFVSVLEVALTHQKEKL